MTSLSDGALPVGGATVARAEIPVTNPATGEVLAHVPRLTRAEVAGAIAAAAEAMPAWAAKTAKERSAVLRRWFEAVMAEQEALARLMTAEQGKPLAEARTEIAYAASFIEWFAEEGKRAYGDIIPSPTPGRRIFVLKQPVGVTAAITPWNFPAAMITRKAAPALAAGCPMIVKPATSTPLTAIALARLAHEAGLDPRLLSVVTGPAAEIAEEFTANATVRKLSFTGSTETGKRLMAMAARHVQKLSLELGGNAPFIVFDDADLDAAVEGAIASKFRNAGQTCVCANRIYAQADIHDAFVEKLAARVEALRVGPGDAEGTEIGPLIDMAAVEKVEEHLADALAHGARLAAGGSRHPLGGTFFQPTLVTGVTGAMKVATEETFGPLAPVFRFETVDEVIEAANATEYGLAAYFYARDLGRVWKVAEALEYGIVGVNTGIISNEVAPFGGVKESGLGREGSRYGLDEYLELKYVNIAV
ncbi:NAD-dependent succinate-semialdehyde dehydrogenase [Thermaurantiacus tibetensis]|uniref:NAD-dependent succinate-semialdehyde dehydrogenase n=1 Tax=Thermaurantiacus tibetensis TaxID=2759035 RepID=UPI00188DF240|nr:NAD-dependent succinate-semialdehyde dehydrogenase [Thermaurantiacus tibetensis]